MQAVIEPAFWGRLGQLKLEELKLGEGPLYFRGSYQSNNHQHIPGALVLSEAPLLEEQEEVTFLEGSSVLGRIFSLNTVERLATFDRQTAVEHAATLIWGAIRDGSAFSSPATLQQAVVLAYCDLKRYRYHHYLAFPVLQPPAPYTLPHPTSTLAEHIKSDEQLQLVMSAIQEGFVGSHGPPPPLALLSWSPSQATVHPLTAWNGLQSSIETDNNEQGAVYMCFIDPSNSPEHPGWPLRNALLAAATSWQVPMLRVICLRTRKGCFDAHASIVLHVNLPSIPPDFHPRALGGWEAASGTAGKAGPKVADLGPSMDPRQLAASAVDLNLQLMRWRAAPTLDVGAVAGTSCLLLGAGTLGCSVARVLLGWGVRKMTFVDNSRVAFSNPARQSLFTFEDCLRGGRSKAQAAAEAVEKIFPDVDAQGVDLSIPMPGHPPSSESEIEDTIVAISTLDELIAAHDVVFLLLDTREARWLPALISAAQGKLAITGALGFDSFLVMRHGYLSEAELLKIDEIAELGEQPAGTNSSAAASGSASESLPQTSAVNKNKKQPARLGCYFCSDIVAPTNSTIDRTMDQQCTVARPGLSGICGSLAAEIMAAVIQHPAGPAAPAAGAPQMMGAESTEGYTTLEEASLEPPLGQVPHMVRGQLAGFSQMCLSGEAFPQCPACSATVLRAYRACGTEFVLRAVSQPRYLEDLTGLTELYRASEAMFEGVRGGGGGDGGNGGSEGSRDGDDEGWEEL